LLANHLQRGAFGDVCSNRRAVGIKFTGLKPAAAFASSQTCSIGKAPPTPVLAGEILDPISLFIGRGWHMPRESPVSCGSLAGSRQVAPGIVVRLKKNPSAA
jgi:hypothetical protein